MMLNLTAAQISTLMSALDIADSEVGSGGFVELSEVIHAQRVADENDGEVINHLAQVGFEEVYGEDCHLDSCYEDRFEIQDNY